MAQHKDNVDLICDIAERAAVFERSSEERYEAFLAVPILRGLSRLGVIVLQDPQPDYFDANDIKALRAIGSQLSTAIENAKLLMDLSVQPGRAAPGAAAPGDASLLSKGRPASNGIAIGTAVTVAHSARDLLTDERRPAASYTRGDFQRALTESVDQLTILQRRLEEEHADIASMIFSAHLLMLKDREFSGAILKRIDDGQPPEQAVLHIVRHYVDIFAASENPRLREKVQDIADLGHRLIQNLGPGDSRVPDYDGCIGRHQHHATGKKPIRPIADVDRLQHVAENNRGEE